VANGVLFSAYHWHQPWMILGGMVVAALFFALPAKLFRSTWMPIVIHAMEYILAIPMILLMLGLI
jgi:CBS-domain-containing membrane protein